MNFSFTKGTNIFTFSNPRITENDNLVFKYNIVSTSKYNTANGPMKDGAIYSTNNVMICDFVNDKKEYHGVELPLHYANKVYEYYIKALKIKKDKIENAVIEVIQGKIPIHFRIDKSVWPIRYIAELKDIDKYISYAGHEVLQAVMYKLFGYRAETAELFITGMLHQEVTNKDNINKKAYNIKANIDGIVTDFDMKLEDAINLKYLLQHKKNDELMMKDLKKKAADSRQKQLLSRYPDSCNDINLDCSIDIISKYVMPDGDIKTERKHTYR